MSRLTPQDIRALVELFDRSEWRKLHVVSGDADLFLSKDPAARRADRPDPAVALPTPAALARQGAPEPRSAPRAETIAREPVNEVPAGWSVVSAPSLGTFYSAPKPGAAPFVVVGQRITADTELCLIEVMKLFTTVRAGIDGVVKQVLVRDAELVELRQPLFYIAPGG